MLERLRIATRKSPLAMWQAEYVQQRLQQAHAGLTVELKPMTTQGDRVLGTPLSKIGGKGLFIKELEQAMLAGEADIAVHSMKDVPMEFPDGLELGPVCEREDPYDAFVSNRYASLNELPQGARLGTSSLRRAAQIRHVRPDLQVLDCRGNVNTRLAKLDNDDYDAIILAAAGLKRLQMTERIADVLDPAMCLPAPGQGAVGIELCTGRPELHELLACLNHAPTHCRVSAERAMNSTLQGGCQVPIAGFATLDGDRLHLQGRVADADGKTLLKAAAQAGPSEAQALGEDVARQLLDQGAGKLLAAIGEH